MGKAKNTVEKVITGLEIEESIDLHITAWKLQPIAWMLIFLFLMAGILGLFGTGPLSNASKHFAGGNVEYQRFHRQGRIMHLTVFSENQKIEVALSHQFLSNCRIETIMPEPLASRNEGEFMIYTFSGADCSFFLRPENPGTQNPKIRINGSALDLSMFIYP